jgi:hypothetical protein
VDSSKNASAVRVVLGNRTARISSCYCGSNELLTGAVEKATSRMEENSAKVSRDFSKKIVDAIQTIHEHAILIIIIIINRQGRACWSRAGLAD